MDTNSPAADAASKPASQAQDQASAAPAPAAPAPESLVNACKRELLAVLDKYGMSLTVQHNDSITVTTRTPTAAPGAKLPENTP